MNYVRQVYYTSQYTIVVILPFFKKIFVTYLPDIKYIGAIQC